MVKIIFLITNVLIVLDFIDLESYLHWETFAKNRMSVSIRILEILIIIYLMKILEKRRFSRSRTTNQGLLRRKMKMA